MITFTAEDAKVAEVLYLTERPESQSFSPFPTTLAPVLCAH